MLRKNLLWQVHKNFHDLRIELHARVSNENCNRHFASHSAPVRAIGRHGIVGIRDMNDARIDRRLKARLSLGIATAIPVLMM